MARWHWHSDEPIYKDREAGVPVASAFWVMASCGSLVLTLRPCSDGFYWGIAAGPIAYLGVMNLPFAALYHPVVTYGRYHALYAMWAFRAICALPLLRRLSMPRPDVGLLLQMLLFVGGMGTLSLCDPTQETRTSFGQPCSSEGVTSLLTGSACAVEESSFWGAFSRKKFVCAGQSQSRDLFRVCDARCTSAPRNRELWYQSCGVPIGEGFYSAVIGHAVIVVLLALVPFRAVTRAIPVEAFRLPEPSTEIWTAYPDASQEYRARPKGE